MTAGYATKGRFRTLLNISRWRFWTYLAGTYLVGYTAGIGDLSDFLNPLFWAFLLFFTFPANLVLYGINDLCDTDTDAVNAKKGTKEHLLAESERRFLRTSVWIGVAVAILLMVASSNASVRIGMAVFLALSFAYSAPPLRLKARPFLDSASNVLYAVPGFIGYAQSGGQPVPLYAVGIAALWTASMHLFSAIPDITSDREAGLKTTATVLGYPGSLVACALLWLGFAVALLAIPSMRPWTLALLVYPLIPTVLLGLPSEATERVYWHFPWLNALVGMAVFFLLAVSK